MMMMMMKVKKKKTFGNILNGTAISGLIVYSPKRQHRLEGTCCYGKYV
jgi:hypothetical protein